MASLKEYRREQLAKVDKLRQLGVNPYPARSGRDRSVGSVVAGADSLAGQAVCLAGRLMSLRQHGQLAFIDLADQTGSVQLICRADSLAADYPSQVLAFADLGLLTRGDFIEAAGEIGRSQTGELSVIVDRLRLLSKVLRPLPEKLDDLETKRRRRYLDMSINPEVRARFERRSQFWRATREFLDQRGFFEINLPILELTTGGAEAKPFKTNMAALDNQEFFLRISHELPLKKMIGGGLEKAYDIGPRFRNEHLSDEHLPEHVAMEWYWAYADWQVGRQLTEELIVYVAEQTFNTTVFDWQGQKIDLSQPWSLLDFATVIADRYDGLDVFTADLKTACDCLEREGIESSKTDSLGGVIDKLWKHHRRSIAGPVWLVNHPVYLSPLSKSDPDQPQQVERFQAIMMGSELANGWSELNDPVDQLERFIDQQKQRLAGNDEAQMLDIDYVEMMEYGLPPICGSAYSERLFWLLEGVVARDGVPMPPVKPEIDLVQKDIYPELYGPGGLMVAVKKGEG